MTLRFNDFQKRIPKWHQESSADISQMTTYLRKSNWVKILGCPRRSKRYWFWSFSSNQAACKFICNDTTNLLGRNRGERRSRRGGKQKNNRLECHGYKAEKRKNAGKRFSQPASHMSHEEPRIWSVLQYLRTRTHVPVPLRTTTVGSVQHTTYQYSSTETDMTST